MDEKLIKELKEKFLKSFPVEFTAIRGMKQKYESLEEYHEYSIKHGKDAFLFHRKNNQELPALFFIPYQRSMVSDRGHQFIQMGKKAEVLHDPEPNSPFAEMVIGCRFKDDLSKNLCVTIVAGMLDDFNAPFYTFMTEAYALKVKKGQDVDTAPSEHPDRQEILMVHTCDQVKTMGTHVQIIGNELGQTETHEDLGEDRRGRFSNLFKEIVSPSQTN
tara:strand:+ start:365 stop:1015 length:651 start_codon:yes stop_codon:yes gene_type:complete